MTPTPEWTAADEDDADRARAVFRDRGDIINRLITERDEARAEVRDLRARVGALHVEAYPSAGWCAGCHDAAAHEAWPCTTTEAVASVGRTEPGGAGS